MSIAEDYVFLVDENLPPDLSTELRAVGLNAYHVNEARKKYQRVTDDMIRRYALRNATVVITADDDFVKSYFDRGVPEKLVFIFNLKKKHDIVSTFQVHLHSMISLLETEDLLEMDMTGVRPPKN